MCGSYGHEAAHVQDSTHLRPVLATGSGSGSQSAGSLASPSGLPQNDAMLRSWIALSAPLLGLACAQPARVVPVEPQATPPASRQPSAAPSSARADSPEQSAAPQLPTAAAQPAVVFGQPLTAASDLEFAQLLAEPDKYASSDVSVQGVVRQVCQTRGCWLELATGPDQQAGGCRVIAQGHAFFVPIDSAGKRARVQGRVEVRNVPAAQVAHMEQEGGHFANKQPDGSARELRIVARSVELSQRTL
jgi:hypothetical protein